MVLLKCGNIKTNIIFNNNSNNINENITNRELLSVHEIRGD